MKLHIKNFKSIVNAEVNLDKPINYFIGKNESGKSNIIDAINLIPVGKIANNMRNFNTDQPATITYWYDLDSVLLSEWNEVLGKKFEKIEIGKIMAEDMTRYVVNNGLSEAIHDKLSLEYETDTIKPEFSYDHELISTLKPLPGATPTQDRTKILTLIEKSNKNENSFLVSYFDSEKSLRNKYTFNEALRDEVFISLWTLLGHSVEDIEKLISLQSTDADKFADLSRELEKSLEVKVENFLKDFWTQNTINFEIRINNDSTFLVRAADVFTNDKKGKARSVDLRSKGMRRYLALTLFIQNIIRKSRTDNIILFDEPDAFLHPNAVIDLKRFLEKTAEKYHHLKFVVATHNPYFVDFDNFRGFNFVAKNAIDDGSQIYHDFSKHTADENTSTIIPFITKLGLDIESFIKLSGKNIVFVEGTHDFFLINAVKDNFVKFSKVPDLTEEIKNFQIVPLGSAGKVTSPLVNLAISMSSKPVFFIFDADKAGADARSKVVSLGYEVELNNIKNHLYVNLRTSITDDKFETQNLFNDTFEGKKIAAEKNSQLYVRFSRYICENDVLEEKTINEFKKLFKKVADFYR